MPIIQVNLNPLMRKCLLDDNVRYPVSIYIESRNGQPAFHGRERDSVVFISSKVQLDAKGSLTVQETCFPKDRCV